MARVVQRRTPPYLLIVFVMLFVLSAVMAVLFFHKYTGLQEEHTNLQRRSQQLISSGELERADITQMMQDYVKAMSARPDTAKTVCGQLNWQVSQLAYLITGLPNTSYKEAQLKAEAAFQAVKPDGQRGLTVDVQEFHRQLDEKRQEIAKLDDVKTQLTQRLTAKDQEIETLKADFETKLNQKSQEVADLDKKCQDLDKAHADKLAQAKKEYQDSLAERDKQIGDVGSQLQLSQRETRKWKTKYEKEIQKIIKPPVDTEGPMRRADGKIARVLPDDNLVYINIGAKDRVTEDLRLTVYPYTGIPDSGAGKGVIEVTHVADNVSEGRILVQDKDNPIIPGDLIANVVYDALRTYNFVVEGQFDIEGTGTPTAAGNKAIRDLVRKYGGRVMKDIDIETDYVVLGDPPSRPRKPEDTDPQDAWDLYQERLKAFNRYEEVKKAAESMQIPRLSGKRFLDLIGYSSPKLAQK